jgi:hypothetical protein
MAAIEPLTAGAVLHTPRMRGVSSTPRLLGFVIGISAIPDRSNRHCEPPGRAFARPGGSQ